MIILLATFQLTSTQPFEVANDTQPIDEDNSTIIDDNEPQEEEEEVEESANLGLILGL